MKLIIISDNGSHHRKINISWLSASSLIFVLFLLIIAFFNMSKYLNKDIITKQEINLLNKFDSVLLKAAKLEGEVKRLNSLGQTIAAKNNIDVDAYLLTKAPAMGGIDNLSSNSVSTPIVTQANLTRSIADLELELENQERRFNALRLIQDSPKPKKVRKIVLFPLYLVIQCLSPQVISLHHLVKGETLLTVIDVITKGLILRQNMEVKFKLLPAALSLSLVEKAAMVMLLIFIIVTH